MDLSPTTPALLFPTISLLMIAYTNRFLAISGRIRDLYARFQTSREPELVAQIDRLQIRLRLIREMQTLGLLSVLCCIVCIFLISLQLQEPAVWLFYLSLSLLSVSLIFAIAEVRLSGNALEVLLQELKKSKT